MPEDGLRTLLNRTISLIYGYPKFNDKESCIVQIAKALNACIDSLLILKGEYSPFYTKKKDMLNKLTIKKEFVVYAKKAINFKLHPNFSTFKDYKVMWEKTVDFHLEIINYYIKQIYPKNTTLIEAVNLSNKISIRKNIALWIAYLWKMRINGIKIRKIYLSKQPNYYIYCSSIFILLMLRNGKDKNNLIKARSYLKKVIDLKKYANLAELREKVILAFGTGEYQP